MKVYGDRRSGNCLKVKYTADRLGIAHEWIDVNIMKGESRTVAFLAMNPAGQVPVVTWADGRALAQSNAIIRYLAHGSPLLPADPFAAAKVDEWLFWEQYSHEPYVAVARFQMVYEGREAGARDARIVKRGDDALDLMERWLSTRRWFANEAFSIADIALYAYSSLAEEGGFSLASRPALRGWIDRVRQELTPH